MKYYPTLLLALMAAPAWSVTSTAAVAASVTQVTTPAAKPVAAAPAAPAVAKPAAVAAKPAVVKAASAADLDAAVPASKPAAAFDENAYHLALGIGYPDVRLRGGLTHSTFVDAKFAFDAGINVFSARVGWNFAELAGMKVFAAAEGGFAQIADVDTVTASGSLAGASLGLEYPFAKNFRVSLDAGPMWLQAGNDQASFSTTDIVYNTALYFYLF